MSHITLSGPQYKNPYLVCSELWEDYVVLRLTKGDNNSVSFKCLVTDTSLKKAVSRALLLGSWTSWGSVSTQNVLELSPMLQALPTYSPSPSQLLSHYAVTLRVSSRAVCFVPTFPAQMEASGRQGVDLSSCSCKDISPIRPTPYDLILP